jgi:4-amino-4-deoxy-L-arabinose transferase-like glycosyltransferase
MRRLWSSPFAWLALIVLVGLAFRFYGLTIGFPFEYHVDESFLINKTLEMHQLGTLKPPTFDYPSFIYYLLLAGAYLIGLFKQTSLYDLYLLGRVLSALFGSATIVVVYLIGKRFENVSTGLLAAAFYASTVTALRESHYYTPDSANTFFIALAIYFMLKVALGDNVRNYLYAGISIGLAAGSKYNGAFLVPVFCFAHLARLAGNQSVWREAKTDPRKFFKELFSGSFVGAGVLSLLVFWLTTPYALISRADFFKDVKKMSGALSNKIVEANHHYIGTPAYWYYLENLLFWAMGPVLEVACLLGFVYALVRHRRQDIVLALWVAIYFYVVGGWLNKAVRYTLPLLPFLAVFGAAMFVALYQHFSLQGKLRMALMVAALGAITLASSFLYSFAYMNVYRQPHPAIAATRWAFANIPDGASILLEGPTPHERPQLDGRLMIYPDPSFDPRSHHYRFVYLEVPRFIDKNKDAEPLRAELQTTLAGVDYIVMTTRWYEGLVNSPEASSVIREYYQALASGSSDFVLIKEITVYPRLFGMNLKDDWAELNFRVFDHPKVWIFKRKSYPHYADSTD